MENENGKGNFKVFSIQFILFNVNKDYFQFIHSLFCFNMELSNAILGLKNLKFFGNSIVQHVTSKIRLFPFRMSFFFHNFDWKPIENRSIVRSIDQLFKIDKWDKQKKKRRKLSQLFSKFFSWMIILLFGQEKKRRRIHSFHMIIKYKQEDDIDDHYNL